VIITKANAKVKEKNLFAKAKDLLILSAESR